MSRKVRLDSIAVSSPCFQDWDSMAGNDQVRFCEHCQLSVHNLSEMTRSDALRLVANADGRICVRYYRNPRGRVITRTTPQKLHRIGRRVSRLAAGAFSASLSLSPAVAQHTPSGGVILSSQNPVATSSLVGVVSDVNQARIVGATISLVNFSNSVAFYVITDDAGEFTIPMVGGGRYKLHIEASGFQPSDSEVFVSGNGETRANRTMEVASLTAEVTVEGGSERHLVISGAMAVMSPDDPFVKAAQEDNMETLVELVAGSDVNLRDASSHTTALEHAVQNGNREMVQFLLGRGADVKARTEAGRTVLMIFDEDATPDLIWDLINAGADVNARDKSGNTPLILAAYENNVEALKVLLEAGADVNAKNEDGETALMIGADHGYINNVRALIVAGANLTEKDNEGKDALAHAMEEESRPVIRYLRSLGAQVPEKKVDEEK